MNTLIEDGLGLMILGMGFVFLFLVLLIFATGFMSSFLTKHFPEAKPALMKKPVSAPAKSTADDGQLTAVITAAIHQHRAQGR